LALLVERLSARLEAGKPVDADAIARRLWPDRALELEPLGGGITNHNFKLVVDGDAYVLRIGGRDTELLGIDRTAEHEASRTAAALGIAPEVVAFVDGCLVTRFVPGEIGSPDPAEAGALLRRLHDGPPIPGRFDSFRVVEEYAATAGTRPPQYGWAKELADRIEARRGEVELRPCHNDLLPANFVHDGDRLRLVDWEYAGMGDPYFDLANFAVNNGLDDDGERALLDAYGGGDERALVLMRFMSDFREAMWGVVQQTISALDFDFAAYADEHFERLERTAADQRFRAAL
jgi:thiamine kinase-like enzyme